MLKSCKTEKMSGNQIVKGRVTYKEATFDPRMYSRVFDLTEHGPLIRFTTKVRHQIFHSGNISGERLLDVGTGPTWYGVYEACRWFKEITLSDISEANLTCLRNWKEGKSQETDNLINYILDIDGQQMKFETASHMVAERVKHIIYLDACKEPFLVGTEAKGLMFDTILLTLCQFNAAHGFDENLKLVKSYSTQLKQGGNVIVLDTLGQTYYKIGNITYKKCSLLKDQLLNIFESCGYELVSWTESENLYNKCSDEAGLTDAKGAFALVCRKVA